MAWSSMFSNMCIATNISTESQSSAASRVDIMSHRESFSNLLDDVNIIDLDTGWNSSPSFCEKHIPHSQHRCY